MSFTSWLFEQIDDLGDHEKFARICWSDVNNGCAHARFSAKDWTEHFNSKHKETADKLDGLLIEAYLSYMSFVKTNLQ